jgi:hypothetical protein
MEEATVNWLHIVENLEQMREEAAHAFALYDKATCIFKVDGQDVTADMKARLLEQIERLNALITEIRNQQTGPTNLLPGC